MSAYDTDVYKVNNIVSFYFNGNYYQGVVAEIIDKDSARPQVIFTNVTTQTTNRNGEIYLKNIEGLQRIGPIPITEALRGKPAGIIPPDPSTQSFLDGDPYPSFSDSSQRSINSNSQPYGSRFPRTRTKSSSTSSTKISSTRPSGYGDDRKGGRRRSKKSKRSQKRRKSVRK
jgi:hypothetical protein